MSPSSQIGKNTHCTLIRVLVDHKERLKKYDTVLHSLWWNLQEIVLLVLWHKNAVRQPECTEEGTSCASPLDIKTCQSHGEDDVGSRAISDTLQWKSFAAPYQPKRPFLGSVPLPVFGSAPSAVCVGMARSSRAEAGEDLPTAIKLLAPPAIADNGSSWQSVTQSQAPDHAFARPPGLSTRPGLHTAYHTGTEGAQLPSGSWDVLSAALLLMHCSRKKGTASDVLLTSRVTARRSIAIAISDRPS